MFMCAVSGTLYTFCAHSEQIFRVFPLGFYFLFLTRCLLMLFLIPSPQTYISSTVVFTFPVSLRLLFVFDMLIIPASLAALPPLATSISQVSVSASQKLSLSISHTHSSHTFSHKHSVLCPNVVYVPWCVCVFYISFVWNVYSRIIIIILVLIEPALAV